MIILTILTITRAFLAQLSEAVKENYVGGDEAAYVGLKRVLNPWLFDEEIYKAHIDLYCEIWHYLDGKTN